MNMLLSQKRKFRVSSPPGTNRNQQHIPLELRMRAFISLLLPLIVAASQLPEVHAEIIGDLESDCVCLEPAVHDITIAAFVCAEENKRISSLYCKSIETSVGMLGLLNNTISLGEYLHFYSLQPVHYERSRFLKDESTSDESTSFTAFVPDDNAMRVLGREELKQMFDADDPKVALYFKGVDKNIFDDHELFDDFYFGPEGRIVREAIMRMGITSGYFDFEELECDKEVPLLGLGYEPQNITTSCSSKDGRRLTELGGSKYVGGPKNTQGEEPRITDSTKLLNGVVHIVNGVLEPELGTDLLLDNVNYLIEEGIFDKEIRKELEELTGKEFEATYPPTPGPGPTLGPTIKPFVWG